MLDLKNVSLAVRISVMSRVLPCLEAEIHVFEFLGRHLGFFHFRLSRTVFLYIPMESWTNNLGNAVEILLISRLWVEIPQLLSWYFWKILQFPVLRPPYWNSGWWWTCVPSYSPDIFRKSHQSIFVYYMWFRNGSEKVGLRVNFTPPPQRFSCEG